ncbi:sulfite exporter TauE/SafE family protein [Marivita hallyeonensis]|uniref:Probable membrane transporter protein n=1 Tax=Marivita hallyeonensis TaxID=996342 RepID=A0A1M5R0S1_9RHOB|nr:sulfite exporter TauE/SafE family protein [Marivita hallyeonensis]SHH19975.1 hypothetical protein SAMN05443551_1577 [Marivita hallyeonensis]
MEDLFYLSVFDTFFYATVLFAASYVRGFSGFGFTGVLFAGLSFKLPLAEIVPLSIALELAASSVQARGIVRDVNWSALGTLLVTGAIGTPIGIFLLGYFPDATLRILALSFVFLSSVYLIFTGTRRFSFSQTSYAVVGSFVGVINGAAALSGLVLALFLNFSDARATSIRATMIAYLFFADLWACALLIYAGYYDTVAITRFFTSVPLLAAGVWLGSRHFASAQPGQYKRVVFGLLIALSATGLVATILAEI